MSHIPRKRFGQNFLRDNTVVDQIIRVIAPKKDDLIVEIGPGEGVLTKPLLQSCGRLEAIEIDRDLAGSLELKFRSNNFCLHNADALRFDFRSLYTDRPLRLVGNLPYNITTPLLFHLFEQSDLITDLHFMLQKEVVDRLIANPGTSNYGRLSIMAQYYCQAHKLFEVSPESFYPPPKVTSAVIRLIPNSKPPIDANPKHLSRVVTEAFSQRRKTLRNSIGRFFTEEELKNIDIDPKRRAETLDLEEFSRIANLFSSKTVLQDAL